MLEDHGQLPFRCAVPPARSPDRSLPPPRNRAESSARQRPEPCYPQARAAGMLPPHQAHPADPRRPVPERPAAARPGRSPARAAATSDPRHPARALVPRPRSSSAAPPHPPQAAPCPGSRPARHPYLRRPVTRGPPPWPLPAPWSGHSAQQRRHPARRPAQRCPPQRTRTLPAEPWCRSPARTRTGGPPCHGVPAATAPAQATAPPVRRGQRHAGPPPTSRPARQPRSARQPGPPVPRLRPARGRRVTDRGVPGPCGSPQRVSERKPTEPQD